MNNLTNVITSYINIISSSQGYTQNDFPTNLCEFQVFLQHDLVNSQLREKVLNT